MMSMYRPVNRQPSGTDTAARTVLTSESQASFKGAEADPVQDLVEQAHRVDRVDAHEEEGDGHRGNHRRQQVEGLDEFAAAAQRGEEAGDEQRAAELQDQADGQVAEGVEEGAPEDVVAGEHPHVVGEAHELHVADAVPGEEAEEQGLEDREQHRGAVEQQGREQEDQD